MAFLREQVASIGNKVNSSRSGAEPNCNEGKCCRQWHVRNGNSNMFCPRLESIVLYSRKNRETAICIIGWY